MYRSELVPEKRFSITPYLPLVTLPAFYVLLVVFTMLVSVNVPGGAYYRIFGVDPLAAAVGMVYEGAGFYTVLFLSGTVWWFFIGTIGWKSRNRNISRPASILGTLLSLLSVLIGIAMTKDAFHHDLNGGALSLAAIFQYAGVGILCLGAFVVTIYAVAAAFGHAKSRNS
jgi:hypothetical protein